jgi:hypothetical protein
MIIISQRTEGWLGDVFPRIEFNSESVPVDSSVVGGVSYGQVSCLNSDFHVTCVTGLNDWPDPDYSPACLNPALLDLHL